MHIDVYIQVNNWLFIHIYTRIYRLDDICTCSVVLLKVYMICIYEVQRMYVYVYMYIYIVLY